MKRHESARQIGPPRPVKGNGPCGTENVRWDCEDAGGPAAAAVPNASDGGGIWRGGNEMELPAASKLGRDDSCLRNEPEDETRENAESSGPPVASISSSGAGVCSLGTCLSATMSSSFSKWGCSSLTDATRWSAQRDNKMAAQRPKQVDPGIEPKTRYNKSEGKDHPHPDDPIISRGIPLVAKTMACLSHV